MERYFTIVEANRALLLVRPIVHDIVTKMEEAQALHNEVKLERDREEFHESTLFGKLKRAEELLNKVEYHMKELESIGVLLKDFKQGIVDFPCLHEKNAVYLCWKLEENAVTYWHDMDESYISRKPVDRSFLPAEKIVV